MEDKLIAESKPLIWISWFSFILIIFIILAETFLVKIFAVLFVLIGANYHIVKYKLFTSVQIYNSHIFLNNNLCNLDDISHVKYKILTKIVFFDFIYKDKEIAIYLWLHEDKETFEKLVNKFANT